MNPPVKPYLMLALLLLPVASLQANAARLIAYAVKPGQIEAAREMTADDCRMKLTVIWTENVELKPNASARVSHAYGGRSATLQIDTSSVAGSTGLRLNLLWAEKVKPESGPERQRSLNTTVLMQPGTSMVVARNLTQVVATGEKGQTATTGDGVIYVLALWADEATK
jgi:hypothetical protein